MCNHQDCRCPTKQRREPGIPHRAPFRRSICKGPRRHRRSCFDALGIRGRAHEKTLVMAISWSILECSTVWVWLAVTPWVTESWERWN